MSILFLEYPRCTTCKKAKKWLDENNINYVQRDITIQNPNKEELKLWFNNSNVPLKKFFNTSGVLYKNLNLKDKIKDMSEDEQLNLLATDGKLVKRPLIIKDNKALIGFKEEDWKKELI